MVVQVKSDIFDLLRQYRADLRSLGAKRFGLFGSFVRGEQDDQSDIDLLVEFEPGRKDFKNFMRLSDFLEEKLGRKVDLLTHESLSPHFGPHILREVEYATTDS
jgi:predicted nucleotidyltransferase